MGPSCDYLRNCRRGGHQHFPAHSILIEDLFMKRVAVKLVPKLPMAEQKHLPVEVSQDMLDAIKSDPDSMRLLAVPQTQEAIERKVISDKRGHYENPTRALNIY